MHTTRILASTLSMMLMITAAGCVRSPRQENSKTASAVLAQAGHQSHFVDASTDAFAAVRHAPSGLVCILPRSGAFDMGEFPATEGNQGAYCSNTERGVANTFLAVKYLRPTNLDAVFSEGVQSAAVRAEATVWRGQPSAADRAQPAGLPHFRIARLEGAVNGKPSYLRIAMSERDGWYYQQFSVGQIGSATEVEAQAGTAWRALLQQIASTKSQTRTGSVS